MKKIILLMALVCGGIVSQQSQAQVSINVNIGSQPAWGPVGYDHVDYYYLPDVEAYYWVPRHQYVYLANGQWIFSAALPVRYRSYDLYSGYKVVVNEPRPWTHFKEYKVKYAGYKNNRGKQVIIRDSNEPKYYVVKGHPKYNGNGHENGHGNGKGNGHGHGHGRGKD